LLKQTIPTLKVCQRLIYVTIFAYYYCGCGCFIEAAAAVLAQIDQPAVAQWYGMRRDAEATTDNAAQVYLNVVVVVIVVVSFFLVCQLIFLYCRHVKRS
jgi:hypothetical protein